MFGAQLLANDDAEAAPKVSDQVLIALIGAITTVICTVAVPWIAAKGAQRHAAAGTTPSKLGPGKVLPAVNAGNRTWAIVGALVGLLVTVVLALLFLLAGVAGGHSTPTASPTPEPTPTPTPTAPPTPQPTAVDLIWMTTEAGIAKDEALRAGRQVHSRNNGYTCVPWTRAKHVDPTLDKDDQQYSVGQAISAIQCNWDGTPDPVLHNFFLYHFPDKTTRNMYFAWDVVYGRDIFECLAPAAPAPSPSTAAVPNDCVPGQCRIYSDQQLDAPSVDSRSRSGSLYFTTIGYDSDDRNCYRYLTFTIGDTLLGVLTSQPLNRFDGTPRMSDLLEFWTKAGSPLGVGS